MLPMKIHKVVIDGNNFSTMPEFYNEIKNKLTKGLSWHMGRNLDAFNDVLRGGFGVHNGNDQLEVHWLNAAKSQSDLGATFDILVKIIKDHNHIKLTIA